MIIHFISTAQMRHFKFIVCVVAGILFSTQSFGQALNGARVTQLVGNPKDSLLVLRNSEYYSAAHVNELGFETIYNKWVQDNESKKKYYPLMYSAWKLCIDKCPEQLNLYLDGMNLHRWMIQACEKDEEKEKYLEELMNIWDMRAENAELINANVRKKSLQTSSNSIRMNKINEWRLYSPYAPKNTDSMYVACYDMYLPIMNDIKAEIDSGRVAGNDLNTSQLLEFFNASFSNYANKVNSIGDSPEDEEYKKQFAEYQKKIQAARSEYDRFVDSLKVPDRKSIKTQAQADVYNRKSQEKSQAAIKYNETVKQLNDWIAPLKEGYEQRHSEARKEHAATILGHFQMIKSIADNVTTNADDDSVKTQFNELIAFCQSLLRNNAHLDDDASTIEKIIIAYGDSIKAHSKDYAWLNNMVSKFTYATDFDPTDPDYVYVKKMRDEAYAEMKAKQAERPAAVTVAKQSTKNYGQLANNAFNQGRSSKDAKYFVLAYHYYNKALKDNPGNSNYKTWREQCVRFIRSDGFFQGLKKGQMISFQGQTLQVP